MRQLGILGLGALSTSLFLCACVGGTDTGNPHDDDSTVEGNDGQLCDKTERELPLGESTALGVSAEELFSWVSGEHREALAWQDTAGDFGPEHGRSEITFEIEPLGARFIDRRPAERNDNGTEEGTLIATDIALYDDPCADSIALDVRLHVSTSGGALDETLEATLEAKAPDFVSGQLRLPTDSLNGSFEAEVTVPQGSTLRGTPQLQLALGLSEYGATGELGLSSEFQSNDGQSVGQGGVGVLARFPADNFCGPGRVSLAADQTLRGLSMAAVLERLNASSPAPLDRGGTLELEFTSTAQRVCVALDTPFSQASTLEFPGSVRLRSSDQSLLGSFAVTLSGEASAGVLEESNASASSEYLLDPAQATAAARSYAIVEPLDFSSYDGGYFQFTSTVTATDSVGALQAYGLDQADCVTNPPPASADGNGSPGCSGTERIPVWGASWSK